MGNIRYQPCEFREPDCRLCRYWQPHHCRLEPLIYPDAALYGCNDYLRDQVKLKAMTHDTKRGRR